MPYVYSCGRVCVVWAGFKLDAFVVFRLFICESSAGGAQSYAAILIIDSTFPFDLKNYAKELRKTTTDA